MNFSFRRVLLGSFIFLAVATFAFLRAKVIGPAEEVALLKSALGVESLNFEEMQTVAKTFQALAPRLSPEETKRAKWGKMLFFDQELSENGQISCASCHQPDRSFTDGRPTAKGLLERTRNTPTIINSFSSFWFYWDGRADSLASQSLNPLEDEAEHGFSRSEVSQLVFKKYNTQYESLFGNFPKALVDLGPLKAKPSKEPPAVSRKVIRFSMASLLNFNLVSELGNFTGEIKGSEIKSFREKLFTPASPQNNLANDSYNKLGAVTQKELDTFFFNVGLSLEAYEKSLVAIKSPFDAFIRQWISSNDPDPRAHFSRDFGFQELWGFQLFIGKGACQLCHLGPHFRDNQFHNIGLPQDPHHLDLGRSQGILSVKADPFNCKGVFNLDPKRLESESCKDLDFLDSETPEAIGAFKTPTLRNISETGPYMRDGRFETLRQVLEHYNRMDTHSGLGFREETLRPLNLSDREIRALEAFLNSLTSPVEEHPH